MITPNLPPAPSEWEPTPHLRWGPSTAPSGYNELQQKWVEVMVMTITNRDGEPFHQKKTIIGEEWRTVPTDEGAR